MGLGRPGDAAALTDRGAGALRERIGEAGAEPRSPRRSRTARSPSRARCRPRSPRRSGRSAVLTGARGPPPPRRRQGYPDLVRLRSGRLDGAPDAIVLPADPAQVAARARRLRGRGRRRGALRRRHQRRRRRRPVRGPHGAADRPRPLPDARVEVDRRSLTATLGAGLRGPEAEAALGRQGVTPRPLPAVLRVRDDRRLRRDPLGRAGLERLRALRRAGHLGADDRPGRASCARWRPPTPPPARRCAS